MIKVGICDDNEIFLKEIQKIIMDYLQSKHITVDTHIYLEGEKLLKDLNKETYPFDLLFLDVDMPHIDGIELAQKIRQIDKKVLLVFLTSIEDRVYETFKFNTFRFIRKLFRRTEIKECLDAAIEVLQKHQETYVLKSQEGLVKLPIEDIISITYINRHLEMETTTGCYISKVVPFKEIIQQFKDKNFVCIHRSAMVNVKYIKTINKTFIKLDNNQKLSISRYKFNEIFEVFTNYAK